MTRAEWDRDLGALIAAILEDEDKLCPDETAICAVLIALHRAVRGEIDLADLAIACIAFDEESGGGG